MAGGVQLQQEASPRQPEGNPGPAQAHSRAPFTAEMLMSHPHFNLQGCSSGLCPSLPLLPANLPLPELSGITQAHNHSKGVFSHPLAQCEEKAHLSLVNTMNIRRSFSWTPPTTDYLALFL